MDKEELKQNYASIHTLRMEGDTTGYLTRVMRTEFQSTPSAWRVTGCSTDSSVATGISIHTLRMEGDILYADDLCSGIEISIHTLRMEGDGLVGGRIVPSIHFNPHPPHGG